MTNKADVERISDMEMEEMFTEVFESIASYNSIDSFECTCKRDATSDDVKVEVMIVGMAGSPTMDDYKNGKLENIKTVLIKRNDKGDLKFKLAPKEIYTLNANDYVAVYKLV